MLATSSRECSRSAGSCTIVVIISSSASVAASSSVRPRRTVSAEPMMFEACRERMISRSSRV
jgi:hypothetical protein